MYFYKNYIYYKIPYNPLVKLLKDAPSSCYVTESHLNNEMDKSSHNLDHNTLIFKYFRGLNLIPLKEKTNFNEIYKHNTDIRFSYMLKFGPPSYSEVFISEIWLDNLTILSIRSDVPGFRTGYYKILGDYKYVNDLITDSQD
jgi:hypothetical protein